MDGFEKFITEKNFNQYNYTEQRKKNRMFYQRLDSLITDNIQQNLQHIKIDLTLNGGFVPIQMEKDYNWFGINPLIDLFLLDIEKIDGFVFTHLVVDFHTLQNVSDVPHFFLIIGFSDLTGSTVNILNYLQKSFTDKDLICKMQPLNTFLKIKNAYKFLFHNDSWGYRNHQISLRVIEKSGYIAFLKWYEEHVTSKHLLEHVLITKSHKGWLPSVVKKCQLIPFFSIPIAVSESEKSAYYICLWLVLYCRLSQIKVIGDNFFICVNKDAGIYKKLGNIQFFRNKKKEILEFLSIEFPIQIGPVVIYGNIFGFNYEKGLQKFQENTDRINF